MLSLSVSLATFIHPHPGLQAKVLISPRSRHVQRPGGWAAFLLRQHQSLRGRAASEASRDGRRALLAATVYPQSGWLRPVCCVEPGVSPLLYREEAEWDLLHRRREESLWASRALWVLQQRPRRAGVHVEETMSALAGYTDTARRVWQPERKHVKGVREADLEPGGEALLRLLGKSTLVTALYQQICKNSRVAVNYERAGSEEECN